MHVVKRSAQRESWPLAVLVCPDTLASLRLGAVAFYLPVIPLLPLGLSVLFWALRVWTR